VTLTPPLTYETRTVRAGLENCDVTGAVVPPLHLSSTYAFRGFGDKRKYDYSRSGNPTRDLLAEALSDLEGGAGAVITGSGMGAITLVGHLLPVGARVVAPHDCYGGTFRLFTAWKKRNELDVEFVDFGDDAAVTAALARPAALVWIETPSNPLLRITDIADIARRAHGIGALVVADNTFLSPGWQRPLELGADIVVHSTTKFLNGHSDSVGGVAVVKDEAHARWLQFYQNAAGAILSPFDSWLVLRGTKTLALRMPRHEENGRKVAEFLRGQRKVRKVYWPGFTDHPGHEVHRRQATGFGALISFDLGDLEAANRLLKTVRLCSLGESLGGIETLISHPATMTHAGYTQAERDALGIGSGLVRISVGCEDAEDLLADLGRALEAV
jgi:cystathionine gamma-synthase